MARAVGAYDRAFMSVIRCLKYKGKIQLARPLGKLLFSDFIRFWGQDGIDRIVPVPLHSKKLRMRGFNQALLLIREWPLLAEAMHPQRIQIHVERDILVRNRWTEPQTGLGRNQRMANIKDAFSVTDASKVENQTILLVDDVYTTGATANECAKVLNRSGAKQVDVLTLARAL
jgi:ComF family protein